MSEYFSKLSVEYKERYIEKLNGLGFGNEDDPFLLLEQRKVVADKNWVDDVSKWPSLDISKIFVYLVKTPGPFTLDQMGSYRSLDAYNFFVNGWVQTCFYKRSETGHCIITGKVNRSQAVTDTPHKAWVGFNIKKLTIDCAHCSCMAGLGEVCSHVAAIMFKVMAISQEGLNQIACTDVPCPWLNQSYVKKIEPVPLNEINFQKPKIQKTNNGAHQQNQAHPIPQALQISDPQELLKDLKNSAPNALIFSIVEPKKSKQSDTRLPALLSSMYSEENAKLGEKELAKLCEEKFSAIRATESQCKNVEESTRSQSKSGLWRRFRLGRITASNFSEVIHTKEENPSKSLIKKLCHGTNIKSPATSWGIDNEQVALSAYTDKMNSHTNIRINQCGLFIHPDYPYLGATPDSIVECDCCGIGLVEVKCPFTYRDSVPCHVHDKNFCVKPHEDDSCDNQLRFNHKYYYQIQGQMGICNVDYCDFVCFTNKGVHIERVLRDVSFFKNMVVKLEFFHKKNVMPELLTRKLKHEKLKISV